MKTTAVGRALGALAAASAVIVATAAPAMASANATFTFSNTTVPRGGTVNGSVTGNSLGSITVSGCGTFNTPVRTGNGPFSVAIPGSQPIGQCTMRFTANFTNDRPPEETTQVINVINGSSATITLDNTSTSPGGKITGTVTGPSTIGAITVSGCGLTNATVRTGPGTFSITIPTSQPQGSCTLTFTIRYTDGTPTQTDARTISITGAPAPPPVVRNGQLFTEGPDLVTVAVVNGAAGDNQPDTVRYTFDEPVAFVSPTPVNAGFRLLGPDSGTSLMANPQSTAVDPGNSSVVIATFADGTLPASYTLGVVDSGVVREAGTLPKVGNTLASKRLVGSNSSPTSGQTSAPDLLGATSVSATTATYCFDARLNLGSPGSAPGVVPSRFGYYTSGGIRFLANGFVSNPLPNCAQVSFPVTSNTGLAFRWFVERGGVTGAVDPTPGPNGTVGGVTGLADLTGAAFVPATSNQIDFTYDSQINVPTDPSAFQAVTEAGQTVVGTSVSRPTTTVARVTFNGLNANIDDLVVLATADHGAVSASATGNGSTVGAVAVPRLKATSKIGPTDGPDLLGIAYDPGANKAAYLLDSAVTGANPNAFFLVGPTGGSVTGSSATVLPDGTVTVTFPAGVVPAAVGGGVTSLYGSQVTSGNRINLSGSGDFGTPQNPNSPATVGGGPGRRTARADFDGDGDTDLSTYRPSTGQWFVKGQPTVVLGGQPGDIPVAADYNGDGRTDRAVFRPGSNTWVIEGQAPVVFGQTNDVPVPADYDGDGDADIAVFRPSTGGWFVMGAPGVGWGTNGDKPVAADYTGDGVVDISVYRPSNGFWYFRSGGYAHWGVSTDVPTPGDFDGDRRANVAVFRPSDGKWYVKDLFAVTWGANGDKPVAADYDGDGIEEVAVYRPSNSQWFVKDKFTEIFGAPGDIPAVR